MRTLRLVAINLGVLMALLVVANLASAVVLGLIDESDGSERPIKEEPLASLPNYRDKRFARRLSQEESQGHYRFAPILGFELRPHRGLLINQARNGDRVTPQPRHPPGAPVVRFFGGSAMFGSGADDRGTIPGIYARHHPEQRVFNHGLPASNTRQNLERLINLANQGARLGTVIFYEGLNDVGNLCRVDSALNSQGGETRMRQALNDKIERSGDPGPSLGAALDTLLVNRTRRLVAKLRGSTSERSTLRCARDPRRARGVATTVLRQWQLARALVEGRGGRFLVALQPTAYLGHPRLDHIPRAVSKHRDLGPELRAVYRLWRRDASRLDWLHDFSHVFDRPEYILIDYVHSSANGNRIVARKLSRLLSGRRRQG